MTDPVTLGWCNVTYHVRPHQPIIDQQGLGLRGLVHKEAHPVIMSDVRLPSQRRVLPLSLDQYLFPFALRVGGWVRQVVGYIPRLYTGKWSRISDSQY